jgi:hypothetical protein
LAAAAAWPAVAGAQAVIRVDPGPGGNPRISTPWGDYIAVRQGGALFVVTEAQYAKGLVEGYAQANGQEAVNLAGVGKTYINKNDVSVQAGAVRLRQVGATIVIGVPADRKLGRPPKPKAAEYVQILWLQQGAGKVGASISVDGQAIKPNSCGASMGFYHCDFTISHNRLAQPASVVFTQQGRVPGLWQVESLSRAHLAGVQRKYAELKMPISGEDAADLQAIARIDPSINSSGSKND